MLCPLIVKYFDIEVTLTNSKGEVTTTPFPTEPEEYMGEEMCILKLKDPAESLPSETQVSFTVTRNAEQPEAGTPIPVYIDFTSKLVVYDAKGTRIRGYQDHSYAEEEVMPTNNLAYMQEIIEETLYTLRAQVTAEGSGTLRSY